MSKKNANRFTLLEAVEASIATRDTTSDLHKLDRELFIHVRELLPSTSILRTGCWCIVKNNKNTFNLCGNTFDNKLSVFCKAHGTYSAGSPTAIMVTVLHEIGKLSLEKHHSHLSLLSASSSSSSSASTTENKDNDDNENSSTITGDTDDVTVLRQRLADQQLIIDRYNTLEHKMTQLKLQYRRQKETRTKRVQDEIEKTTKDTSSSSSSSSSPASSSTDDEVLKTTLERALTAENRVQVLKEELNTLRLELGGFQEYQRKNEETNHENTREIENLTNQVQQYKDDAIQYRNLEKAITTLKLAYRASTKTKRTSKTNELPSTSSSSSSFSPDLAVVRDLHYKLSQLENDVENKNFIIETQNGTISNLQHELTELQEKLHLHQDQPSPQPPSSSSSLAPSTDELLSLRHQYNEEKDIRHRTEEQLSVLQKQYKELEEAFKIDKLVLESQRTMDNQQAQQDKEWLAKLNELTTTYTTKLQESDTLLMDEKKNHQHIQKNYEITLEALRNQLTTKQEQINQNEEIIRGLRMEIELVNNEKESIRKDSEKLLENQRKEWEAVFAEIHNASQQANNEAASTAETLLATREALQDALVRQSEFTATVSDTQEQVHRLHQQIHELTKKEKEANERIEVLTKEKDENNERIRQLMDEVHRSVQNITESKAQFQAKVTENQVIQEQLSKATNETSHLSTHIENLKAQLEASKRYTEELEKQLRDMSTTVNERNLRILLTDTENKLKQAESTVVEMKATNDSLRQQLEEVRTSERKTVTELRELRIIENELRIQLNETKALYVNGGPKSSFSSPSSVPVPSIPGGGDHHALQSPLKPNLSPSVINQLPSVLSTPHSTHPDGTTNVYTPYDSHGSSLSSSSSSSSMIPRLEPPTPVSSNWGLHTPEQINSLHNTLITAEKKEDTLGSSLSSPSLTTTATSSDSVVQGGVETRNRASMAATLRVEEYMRASAEVDRLSDLRTRLEALTARYSNSGGKLTNSNQKYKVLTPGSLLSTTGLSPASTATAYMLSSPLRYGGETTGSHSTTAINLQNPPSRADFSANREKLVSVSDDTFSSVSSSAVSVTPVPPAVRQLHLDG